MHAGGGGERERIDAAERGHERAEFQRSAAR